MLTSRGCARDLSWHAPRHLSWVPPQSAQGLGENQMCVSYCCAVGERSFVCMTSIEQFKSAIVKCAHYARPMHLFRGLIGKDFSRNAGPITVGYVANVPSALLIVVFSLLAS